MRKGDHRAAAACAGERQQRSPPPHFPHPFPSGHRVVTKDHNWRHAHRLALILARTLRCRIGDPRRRDPVCLSHQVRYLGQLCGLIIGQPIIKGGGPCGQNLLQVLDCLPAACPPPSAPPRPSPRDAWPSPGLRAVPYPEAGPTWQPWPRNSGRAEALRLSAAPSAFAQLSLPNSGGVLISTSGTAGAGALIAA